MNMRQYIARMVCGVMMVAAAIGSSSGQVPEIHVDTIDSVAVICPGETLVWHGIEAAQTGTYTHNEVQLSGKENFYRLQLTVRELVVVDSTFTICEDEYVQFNGKIYTDPGHYYDQASCDTMYHIYIRRIPARLYVTQARLADTGGYTWTYWENGTKKTQTFTQPGTYEYESFNPDTECPDKWRLILTKDTTSYHFVEELTICESEPFSWHGRDNLNKQPGTSHYYDNYTTRAGLDSIYELVLTVIPIKQSTKVVNFCGQMTWKGQSYDHSFVGYDTLASSLGCDSIVRIYFDKAASYYYHDTATIVQGETLLWHGQQITTDGTYRDVHLNQLGCDSIYELGVGVIAATPQTNLYTTHQTICEGDFYEWRGNKYMTGGTYVDTVFKAGGSEVDSIFSLHLAVRENYADTIIRHLYTCGPGAFIRYQAQDYYEDTVVVSHLHTINGCDSIVKTYLHFNTALYLSDTVKIASTELPYLWTYRLADIETDTLLTGAGTYNHVTKAEGSCYNREQLVLIVYPTYLFEQDTTICETDLPFFWLKGPIEHQSDPLQHAIGTTLQYEYRYTTVNGTDSIYRLRLTISEQPKRVVHYHICEGENLRINGINYNDAEYLPGQVYRDTTYRSSTEENVCDSMIITEVEKQAVTRHYETKILDYDQSLPYIWHEKEVNQLGLTPDTIESSDPNECYQIEFLNLIQERRDFLTLCQLDTATNPEAFVWHEYDLKNATSGIFHDTVFDATGMITDFFTLELTMNAPVDTMIFLRGCMPEGVTFNDKTYFNDTILRDTLLTCDTIYTLHIQVGQKYSISIVDTVCEHELPYILGRQAPQEIWAEGFYTHNDTTALGCDSTISLTLRIIPSLPKSDSTFLCEDDIKQNPVVLGNLINPTFALGNGGQYEGAWEGKWQGVSYHNDTIVYNCDSSYFHHIIVRPSQKMVKDTTLYLCPGDTLQLFYPRDDSTWFYRDTVYEELVPMPSIWTDGFHHRSYADDAYSCDSITRWHIKVLPREQGKEEKHILLGDSTWWGGAWRYYTGIYDSIAPAKDTSSFGDTCTYIRQLYLYVDTVYYYRDTIDVCVKKNQSLTHTWYDGHVQHFTVGSFDMEARHYTDSLITYDRRDSIYDLCVNYRIIRDTLLFDTICSGDSIQFDRHYIRENNNTTIEQYIHTAGIYRDTLMAVNGCDSIVTLYLYVRDRIVTIPKIVDIADSAIPYVWTHSWKGTDGQPKDSTQYLNASGIYTFPMESVHGCDSIDSLVLRVHKTYNIQEDTLYICHDQTPYTWEDRNDIIYSGDYAFHTLTFDGYDSTRFVHIEVLPIMHTLIVDTICEGDSLRFGLTKMNRPRFLTEIGVYYDTLTSHQHGCDSIIELRLNVYPKYRNHTMVDIADKDLPYTWDHIQGGQVIASDLLNGTGEYTYHFTTPFGCDSVDSLSLRVHRTYLIQDDTIRICSDQTPYTWHDYTNIAASGFYTYYGQTHDGYDSIHTVYIEVSPVVYTTIYREICEDDIYTFAGMDLTTAGEYRDTLLTEKGCDSIVTLHLNVLKKYYNTVDRSIYEGDTVMFQGQEYSASGAYPVRFTSSYGCDSIIELRLTVMRLFDDSISVCANALPYLWRGQTIYESGIYRDTVYDTFNNPSVTGIKVTILPFFHKEEAIQFSMCEGDFYKFGDSILTKQGIYYDTLTAANGCDSIVMLALTVHPTNYYSEVRRIFEGDSALFNGVWYKESGVYEYRLTNANGCNDTYQMILTVLKSSYTDTTAVVCDKDLPFVWRGYEYNESGDYSLPIAWTDSSRVVKTLHLTVYHTFYGERNIAICEGDTFLFRGNKYCTSGELYDTIPSLNGCDSIIKYVISVHPTFDILIDKHISDKEPFDFHGRSLTQTGTYEWTGKTINGCDSVEHLSLTVHPSFFKSDTLHICQSDENYPYVWQDENGRIIGTYSESGVYNDSVLTAYGFDSVHQIVLFVHPSYMINEQYEIGEGEHLKIHGLDISTTGVYYNDLLSIHGCDSIYHLVVNKKRTREFYRTAEICQGDFYEFFGRKLTHTGNYTYTSQYKDSIVYLSLTVKPVSISEKRIVITDKQLPYIYDGRLYDAMGVYSDTLVNMHGCDSVKRLVLVVTQRYSDWDPIPLCPGSEVKIDGKVITEAGLYTFERRSRVTGEMDSLYRVEVYDAPAFDFPTETISICDGDTFLFAGKAHTRGGHYDYTLKTINGCDSILHLDLTVNPTYHFITDTTITDYQSVLWRGKTYFETGDYNRTWPTINDCDSTYTLSMKVVETLRDTATVTICSGQSYLWRGRTLENDGFYADTVWQPEARFSAIYALRLIVAYPTNIISARTGDICADADGFDIFFEYTGQKPTHYSVYFDALAKREGFVDIIDEPLYGEMVAHIQLPQFNSIAYETHPYYVRPDYYTLHIALDNGVCGISRSDSIELLIKYPSWIIEQNWMDVVAPLKAAYNGGFEFANTEWFINGVQQTKATAGYLYSTELIKGDQVVMKATRKGENYAIPTCPLVITDPVTTANDVPVIVNPTQAPKTRPVFKVTAPKDGLYEVYSATGTLLLKGTLLAGETELTLPATSGIYFIRTRQGDETATHKVLIF